MSVLMALILEVAVTNELLRIDIPYSKYVIITITFHLQIFKTCVPRKNGKRFLKQ